jgi:hypothetical protein
MFWPIYFYFEMQIIHLKNIERFIDWFRIANNGQGEGRRFEEQ